MTAHFGVNIGGKMLPFTKMGVVIQMLGGSYLEFS